MGWGQLVQAGVQLGSSYLEKEGQEKAAKGSQQASDAAIAEQRAAREAYQQNISPYLALGGTGLQGLQALYAGDTSGFMLDPGYQFARDQGLEAIRSRAAAGGGLAGGGTSADLANYATGLAQQGYADYYNRLYNLATLGQNAAVGAGTAGQNTASNIGNLLTSGAQNQAGYAQNIGNIYGQTLGGLANIYGQYQGNQPQNTGGYGSGFSGQGFGNQPYYENEYDLGSYNPFQGNIYG